MSGGHEGLACGVCVGDDGGGRCAANCATGAGNQHVSYKLCTNGLRVGLELHLCVIWMGALKLN